MSYRNRVWVSTAALRHNAQMVLRQAQGRSVVAVVKADAYGLGIERCVPVYAAAGIRHFAVASLGEAERVRTVAADARIILLAAPLPGNRSHAVAAGFEVCCSQLDELADLAAAAEEQGRPALVHLFVDTAMGRTGCLPGQARALLAEIARNPHVQLVGIGSHYPQADDAVVSAQQEAIFADLLAQVELPDDCLVHLANSEGLLLRPAGAGNTVRVGILLTGVTPASCTDLGLQLAARWESAISLIKELPAGHRISYGGTCTLQRSSRIAMVPVGYADGYPFAISGRPEAAVGMGSCRCPLLGRVTMDYLIIDVTDCADQVQVGDPVELFGSRVAVTELANWAGTLPYDILCGLRGRCEVVTAP